MIIVKKKAQIARFGLFLALVVLMAYYITGKMETWRTSQSAGSGTQPVNTELQTGLLGPDPATSDGKDFFASFRLERDRERGARRETLKEIMESQGADAENRKQATQQYMDLSRQTSLEAQAERMVKAKGFDDAVVHIAEGSAQVIVKAPSVSEPQFRQILDVVSRTTGVKPTAIQVSAQER